MIIKCNICWNDFVQKTYSQLYCWSLQCKKKVISIRARKDYDKHKERCKENAKKLRYTKECDFCSKEFKTYTKAIITCSNECYRKRMAKNRIWEGNPAYRNWVYMKWGEKVKIHQFNENIFKKACKEMNEEMILKNWYRFCEYCGINNSLRWEHHHIIFRSEKPRHEFLHDKRNILHVCIKCHNQFHKNKSIRDTLVKERWLDKLFWLYI
jgi:hypothetical protein